MSLCVPLLYIVVELSWHDHSDEELRLIFDNSLGENTTEF